MEEKRSNGLLIIPALNPEEKFVGIMDEFMSYFTEAILVDDGSHEQGKAVFAKIAEKFGDRVHILTHEKNGGKGKALKTAFAYYVSSGLSENYVGVITADCDGQHAFADCVKLDESLGQYPNRSLHIGYRDLYSKNMPFRSKFGNRSTALLFNLLYGVKLKDTQSGLRAFSNDLMDWLMEIKGDRFEYEMNMLILSKNADLTVYEIPIETRYEVHHTSHYRTLQDSVRVLKVLFGGLISFILAALVSAGADLGIFALLYYAILPTDAWGVSTALLLSTVVSRVLSSVVNFLFNRLVTFGGKRISRSSILKYYLLWGFQLAASYGCVLGLTHLFGGGEFWIKLVVDLILSLCGYQVQLRWVFKKKVEKRKKGERDTARG